ncbi:hypothetical protein BTJ39_05150 [Izhakiella australiensis]|uniref:Inverse autotransporter beta-domain domain-containing protein n=1 Tax=Izhakiella australiensis TaxID=1926881 RepID=A0A1S8YQB7_9GAMM|nr:inverse autotransporter beta domain-containing protein [Izhakiella australiensis]OON41351.1 hypothetical protein BTJ39_05150 [Izhakiella australiensis]
MTIQKNADAPGYILYQKPADKSWQDVAKQLSLKISDVDRWQRQLAQQHGLTFTSSSLLPADGRLAQIYPRVKLVLMPENESMSDFAWRYKLAPEQLIKLNRHVKHSSQLVNLPGQWVIVPDESRTAVAGTSEGSEKLRNILGSFWQSAQHNGAVSSARTQAENALSASLTAEVENWLSQSGARARVTAGAGLSKGSSSDLGLDYLYPFINGKQDTLFVQMNGHRWNERNIFNAGIGWRHNFNPQLLGGVNAFYDKDVTRHHSRLGMGLELWSDRLHGAFNYYLPLSEWKRSDAPFLSDSDHYVLYERAARGWDLSFEVALARTVYGWTEFYKWYGEKVDVTGSRNQASKNPYGMKIGLKWQPLPLIALHGEKQFISGQSNNINVGVEFSWEFGRSLAEMLNADNAQALPSLQASRTDFVHRNNNIVLAYKEQKKSWHIYFDPAELAVRAGSVAFINAVKGSENAHVVYSSTQPQVATVDVASGRVVPLQVGQAVIIAELFASMKDTAPAAVAQYRLSVQPGDFAPSASDVQIQGEAAIGNTLTGSYVYNANQGEAESGSVLQWFHADAMTQPLATGASYQVAADDIDKDLVFQVIPQNKNNLRGAPAMAQIAGPTLKLVDMKFEPLNNGVRVDDVTVKYLKSQTGKIQFSVKAVDEHGRALADRAIWWHQGATSPGSLSSAQTRTDSEGRASVMLESITTAGRNEIVASLHDSAAVTYASASPQQATARLKVLQVEPEMQLSVKDNVQQVLVGADPLTFTLALKEENQLGVTDRPVRWLSNGKEAATSRTDSAGVTTVELPVPALFAAGTWRVEAILSDKDRRTSLTLALQKNHTEPLSVDDVSLSWGDTAPALQVTGGNNSTLFYHSDNEAVVTVNQRGQLTLNGIGAAKITVSQHETETQLAPENASAKVTIAKGLAPELIAPAITATYGDKSRSLTVSGGNDGGALSYRSGNENIVSVDADGQLTFTGAGSTTVTVSQAATATQQAPAPLAVTVTVNKKAPNVNVSMASTMQVGGTQQVTVTSDSDGRQQYSLDLGAGVLEVTSGGLVTALKTGSGNLAFQIAESANYLAASYSWKITVALADAPVLSAQAVRVTYGDKAQKLTVGGGNDGGALSYRSGNDSVVSVNSSGQLTFTGAGSTTVTVSQAATATQQAPAPLAVTVTVNKKAPNVNVSMASTMQVGGTQQVTVTSDSDGRQQYSLDLGAGVLEVTSGGLVTALKTGSGNLAFQIAESANYQPASYSWGITVALADAPVLSAQAVKVTYGDKAQKLTVGGGNDGGALSYRSGNDNVVSVNSSGQLTFTGAGSTTVTVTQAATATHQAPSPLAVAVTVEPKTPDIHVSFAEVMQKGGTQQVAVTSDSDGKRTFGADADKGVLSVTNSGQVTALKAGWGSLTFRQDASTNYRAASVSVRIDTYGIPAIASASVTPAGSGQINGGLSASYRGFDAQGTGSDASLYQWYWRKVGDTSWQKSQKSDSKNKQFTPDASYAGYEVRVGVTPKGSDRAVTGQEVFSNAVSIYAAPAVRNQMVSSSATVNANTLLTGRYDFDAQGTGEDASLYQWYWRKVGDSSWQRAQKSGAQSTEFTPDASYAGYEVRLGITPRGNKQSIRGTEVFTSVVTVYGTPVARNQSVSPSGSAAADTALKARYDFDAQGTGEDASLYQWYWRKVGDSSWQRAQKSGAQSTEFTPDASYAGYEVRLGITPRGNKQSIRGTEAFTNVVTVYGIPAVRNLSVSPSGSVLPNTPLSGRYDFDAQGTGADASLYQWYWRKVGDTSWQKSQKSDSKSRQFTPDASYAGYEVQLRITPKGSQQNVQGAEVLSSIVSVSEPVTWHIAQVKHYYYYNFVKPWVYEPQVYVVDNKGRPVGNVEVCFKIYRGAIPGLPGPGVGGEPPLVMPSEASFTTTTDTDGVTFVKQASGTGGQKLHIRAWICKSNRMPSTSLYMGDGKKDWYTAPADWQTTVKAN